MQFKINALSLGEEEEAVVESGPNLLAPRSALHSLFHICRSLLPHLHLRLLHQLPANARQDFSFHSYGAAPAQDDSFLPYLLSRAEPQHQCPHHPPPLPIVGITLRMVAHTDVTRLVRASQLGFLCIYIHVYIYMCTYINMNR